MNLVWATMSRSGSQFLLKLTFQVLAEEHLWPQARISGARVDGLEYRSPSFHELYDCDDPIKYFDIHNIKSVKIEDPGINGLAAKIADAYPESKWLTSLRDLNQIIISHYNIIKWGQGEAYILKSFKGSLKLFKRLADENRLFIVNIDKPKDFDLDRFVEFVGGEATDEAKQLVKTWAPINTLAEQQKQYDESNGRKVPSDLHSLRSRILWVKKAEEEFYDLWKKCS